MIIYGESGKALYDVTPDDDSYRMREVKGDHAIYLNVTSPIPMELPLGCYVNHEGVRYSLEEPPVITKRGARDLAYQCVFSAPQALLKRYRFRNTVDGRLKFQITAKPHEHLEMLLDNLNLRGSGWTAGECIEDVEKVIDYDYTVCYNALEMIAEAFGTEWEIQNKVISLKKVEYNKDNPLPLSYGKGNGFVSGVGRNNQNDQDSGLEIVYAIGGDRNVVPDKNTGGQKKKGNRPVTSIAPLVVNPNKELVAPMQTMASAPVQAASVAVNPGMEGMTNTELGSEKEPVTTTNKDGVAIGNKNLILPRSQELEYEGEVYATDDQGYYVYKKNKPLTTHKEGALDCSDIYPSRVGTISHVITVDAAKNFYDFVDNTIPADLDYSQCLIEGEKMTVIFQDGMLAGKEFDVNYKHAERRFEIVPQDIDNVTMPNDIFKPVVGGKYAVFNVQLPDAYVCDNATKTGASWDMFRKAAAYLHDHADYLFTFNGKLDGIWASRNWEGIKDRLIPGGTILFSDNQFQPDGVKIRITAIKDYLNDPYRPEIELSNDVLGQRLTGRIAELENREVSDEASAASQRQYTKRTFRDAKSTMQALQEALESFQGEFTEGISPITVNTMQLLVGSERCQFEFVSGLQSTTVVNHSAYYDDATKTFHCASGYVRYSYGTTMSDNLSETTKTASVGAFTSRALTEEGDPDKFFYIYIKVNTQSTSANFELSDKPEAYEQGSYLYLLLGILDKEQFANRTWSPMYGYTEITPGRIRVNEIRSSDGKTYFDLKNNEIGGRINFVDGLVSGLIGVGTAGNINAGMSGEGTSGDSVRIWSGASEANRGNAPCRIMHNGDVVMNNAMIGGNSTFQGVIEPYVLHINESNYDNFVEYDDKMRNYRVKLDKIATLKSTIIIDYLRNSCFVHMISYYDGAFYPQNITFSELEKFIGCYIRVINKSDKDIAFLGGSVDEHDDSLSGIDYSVGNGREVCMRCDITTQKLDNKNNDKAILWKVLYLGPKRE